MMSAVTFVVDGVSPCRHEDEVLRARNTLSARTGMRVELVVTGRVPAYQDPALACNDLMGAIEIKGADCGASDCGQADYEQPIVAPAKMIGPTLGAGMIQINDLATFRIRSQNLGALPFIALTARAPKVHTFSRPTSCHGQDVLDAQQAAREALVGATVTTAMTGVGKNLRGKLNRNVRTPHVAGTGSLVIGGGV